LFTLYVHYICCNICIFGSWIDKYLGYIGLVLKTRLNAIQEDGRERTQKFNKASIVLKRIETTKEEVSIYFDLLGNFCLTEILGNHQFQRDFREI